MAINMPSVARKDVRLHFPFFGVPFIRNASSVGSVYDAVETELKPNRWELVAFQRTV
jgi:hypothetical protein